MPALDALLLEVTDQLLPEISRVNARIPFHIGTPGEIEAQISRSRITYREKGLGIFAVIELESGRFAGRAGFAPMADGEVEVGYVLLADFWGRGLAQESLRWLLSWAKRNIDAPRIVAYAPRRHAASFNVMKKSGMTYFKTATIRGIECDFYQYPLQGGRRRTPVSVVSMQ